MARSPFEIRLSLEERAELERRVACYTLPFKVVQRAKMILCAADGLTNAEDEARTEAAALAAKTAEATPTDDVVAARVGDSDPVKAIEDALRTFAADEVLVVAHPDDQAGWLAEGAPAKAQARFSLPITVVTVAADGSLAIPNG